MTMHLIQTGLSPNLLPATVALPLPRRMPRFEAIVKRPCEVIDLSLVRAALAELRAGAAPEAGDAPPEVPEHLFEV